MEYTAKDRQSDQFDGYDHRKRDVMKEFATSEEAYDACQIGDLDGCILYIPSEGVVGIGHIWPCAVTKLRGDLHRYSSVARAKYFGHELIDSAIAFAESKGLKCY